MDNTCAVILAAGKGTRMNSTDQNKVTLEVGGQPIIKKIIEVIRSAGIPDIVVVVGFAKESVTSLLDDKILVADQGEALGTGHAVQMALSKVPEKDNQVLVLYGDDAFWFAPEILRSLYQTHTQNQAGITFCTTEVDNPIGLGRIIRNSSGQVIDIVEEKVATNQQKAITEVNLGGFLFNKTLLEKYIGGLPKNPVSGEYYLTDLIPLTALKGEKIDTLKLENFTWRGINTPQELQEAQQLLK